MRRKRGDRTVEQFIVDRKPWYHTQRTRRLSRHLRNSVEECQRRDSRRRGSDITVGVWQVLRYSWTRVSARSLGHGGFCHRGRSRPSREKHIVSFATRVAFWLG